MKQMNNGYFANVSPIKRNFIKLTTTALRRLMPNVALSLSQKVVLTPVKRPSRWPDYIENKIYYTQFGKVHIYSHGEGPVIWLVHGWSGCGYQFWPLMQKLAKRGYTCKTFDFPAHGLSEGSSSSLPKMIDCLDELAKILPQPGLVITHSMGASTVANSVWFQTFEKELMLIAPILETYNLLKQCVEKAGFDKQLFELMINDAFLCENALVPDMDAIEPLSRFKGNLKIIHDNDDQFSPITSSKKLAKFSGAELHITHNLGHGRILKSRKVSELT